MTSGDPIFIVGTHRSGTSWLGSVLSLSRDLAYWSEPRQVWEWGNWFRKDDVLTAKDARPTVQRHIRRRFERFVDRSGATRLCEKTPINCLRLGFITAIYPRSKILFLVRDGRAVVLSTLRMQQAGAGWARVGARLKESSPLEYLSFLTRMHLLTSKVRGEPARRWGARPPGWKNWMNRSLVEVAARQWIALITSAREGLESLEQANVLRIRFEDLVTDPESSFQEVVNFLELEDFNRVVEQGVSTARPDRAFKWRCEESQICWDLVYPRMRTVCSSFGYEW